MRVPATRARLALVGAGIATLGVFALSLRVGPTDIDLGAYVDAVFAYDPDLDTHLVARGIRLPRALLALLVGGSLAAAGAVMQGVSRNPLAGPSLLGLSGGASLATLIALVSLPHLTYTGSIFASLLGAAVGYGAVLAVAALSPGGFSPTRLTLAGAALAALFSAVTHGLLITFGMADKVLFWTAGGITNATWDQLTTVLPFLGVGAVVALALAPAVSILNLGRETAVGLGQNIIAVRVGATASVLLLAGGAAAVAGPVAFVGLMVPHLCRLIVGPDYRRVIPLSMLVGAAMTGLADVGARALLGDGELPLGVVTALVGAPCFVWLIRGHRRQNLDGGAPTSAPRRAPRPRPRTVPILIGALLTAAVIALHVGRYEMSTAAIIDTLLGDGTPEQTLVLLSLRLPRIAFGVLVGAGISVSGVLLQGVLRNDLAEPGLIGVSAGAGFAVIAALWLLGPALLSSTLLLPAIALVGALAATATVALLGFGASPSSPLLVLIGVAVSSALGAGSMLISLQMSDSDHAFAVAWAAGSLNAGDWSDVALLAVALGALLPLSRAFAPTLDVLRLGDEAATGLGVVVARVAFSLLALGVMICAACMALGGGILFLGLLAPHIARRLVGADHAAAIPAAALVGATLLVVADIAGSQLVPSVELPAGIMVSALGAPYFLYLLARR